ncbi:uncharacterized protein EV420DRAFT_1482295 [Desarmillaria tabescens]|uniref:Uncharacterized protein n=1 Tax=Armillaria tabescens TaxID=1929756 RepID=A0AA39MZB7_ARMTA|nr:uncharacterized protein EV420DRAFT_1482295 [Desarmillaria tabescens]KAK0452207.1 hypothetical protein EV420DRAFT_1482295 [Desarmillaria tabescens]
MSSPQAEAIRRNPALLTKLAAPNEPVRAWDGLSGALVNDHIYVTSPNCTLLYEPPLGVNREMWMRNDFRYGDDDPMSWPQPYCGARPHLPCVRLCERDACDPDLPLFTLPLFKDFEELDRSSLIRGPGLWAAKPRRLFQERCRAIMQRCKATVRADQASTAAADRADQLMGYASMFLERLSSLPLTYHRLCLCVAETQRLVLEVEAIWKFFSHLRPKFTGPVQINIHQADVDMVGCFTTDIGIAQQFVCAGVPVWLLRSLDTLPHTRIDRQGILHNTRSRVHMGTCPLRLPSVYIGSSDDEEKYKVFDRFMQSHLGAPNVFLWTPGQQRSAHTLKAPLRVGRGPVDAIYHPYHPEPGRSRRGNLKPQSLNRFVLIDHELLPEISPPWKDGLLSIDASKDRINVPAAPFAFPRPDLFVTITEPSKRMSAISSWLRLRPGHLAMQVPSYRPAKLSHQMWRTILSYDWVGRSAERDRVRGRDTKRRELALKFLEGCLDELSMTEEVTGAANWYGKPTADLAKENMHEILWELAERGFRLEFLSLDKHLREIDRETDVRKHLRHLGHCFPRGQYDQCWNVDLSEANHGLGETSWMCRAPYVCSMRRVMSKWKACPESISTERGKYTDEAVRSLEFEMAKFYCDSFYVTFGRAPTLPRWMEHTPAVVGDFPERAVALTQSSGYYMDLTEWESPY